MLVLHANWMNGTLRLWGESQQAYLAIPRLVHAATIANGESDEDAHAVDVSSSARADDASTSAGEPTRHPFASSADELLNMLTSFGPASASSLQHGLLRLRLPRDADAPWPSDRLARRVGAVDLPLDPWLGDFDVPCVTVPAAHVITTLLRLDAHRNEQAIDLSHSVRYWIAVANFVIDLIADQRFIPTLMQVRGNGLKGAWQPWLHDDEVRRQVAMLLKAMPPVVRAVVDDHQGRPWPILDEALRTLADVTVRSALTEENFIDAVEDRDVNDPHVAWLTGLLGWQDQISAPNESKLLLLRDATAWVGRLDDTGQDRPLHLCLKLNEPVSSNDSEQEPVWILSLHLQSPDDPGFLIDATEVWTQPAQGSLLGGRRVDQPQELLLAELGRASRVYPKIETALAEQHPTALRLSTREAYEFLREAQPLLEESGVGVVVPEWWDQPLGRLAARLHIDAPPVDSMNGSANGIAPAASMIGLNSLVKFSWQIAIGDQPLSMAEFQALAQQTSPLVQVRGKWIEISPEQLAQARDFLEKTPAGEMTLLEAIQIAHGSHNQQLGLPVHGMDATGWVADLLNASSEEHRMPLLEQPDGFKGSLRPYQKTGLSWLAFLDRFGLGACLADDMGLGKTIQLIAMLLHERESMQRSANDKSLAPGSAGGQFVGPTLLIVPTSVVSNWVRELERFAPALKVHVQHGPDRPLGEPFGKIAGEHDLVLTTYPLISRDLETLRRVRWHRVALDEAQYIKNPPTKQTTAIRSLHTPRRLALTGTPVENRLSELWSIMEFCNPGYLGSAGEFRRRFAVPIERHRNRLQAEQLRQMVRPFILRRVKTDPNVIDDLPSCTETKEYATLTIEQAGLYQQVVNAMLGEVDRSTGIQRRGLVLATLVKLKQICNHPAQAKSTESPVVSAESSDQDSTELSTQHSALRTLSSRSGKAKRLMIMLEEVIASGEKALIFTQFRQMGHLLTSMIESDLDCQTLFLHGGTPAAKRQGLIDRFQADDGGVPIFVLSLKAGGLGLNLTAANHVFHYDRWWNPAVESQATDRAFRIGQMRAVHVHKFVCMGTLEERIDQMIEQKTELAQNIIGAGEQWLTELSTSQLHELLMLRPSAMESDS